jgi:hypothetical protein
MLEKEIKKKTIYVWNSKIVTSDNKTVDMIILKEYMETMMTDMNNDKLELFYG